MKILIVPAWLRQTLTAANRPVSDALELSKLAAILSTDDVAFYFSLQTKASLLLTPSVTHGLCLHTFCDDQTFFACEESRRLFETHQMMDLRSHPAQVAAWFGPLKDAEMKFGLTSDVIADDVIAVSPYVLDDEDTRTSAMTRFYERLIGQLCLVQPFENVARTELFKAYVRLL